LRRIGIIGGSFNPVHLGHIHAAKFAKRKLGLTEVWFIPAFLPPHKSKELFVSSYHRFAMLSLATHNYPYFKILTTEVETSDVCYTIDTIKKLMKIINSSDLLYFILGNEAFLEIQTWKDYQELIKLINFVILQRNKEKQRLLFELPKFIIQRYASSLEEFLNDKDKNIITLKGKMLDISSSMIREKLQEGEDVDRYLAKAVSKYIRKYKLYCR